MEKTTSEVPSQGRTEDVSCKHFVPRSSVLPFSTVFEIMHKASESEASVSLSRLECPRQQQHPIRKLISAPPACHTQTLPPHCTLRLSHPLVATDFVSFRHPLSDLSTNLQTSHSQWHWLEERASMLQAEPQRRIHTSEMQRFFACLWSCRR